MSHCRRSPVALHARSCEHLGFWLPPVSWLAVDPRRRPSTTADVTKLARVQNYCSFVPVAALPAERVHMSSQHCPRTWAACPSRPASLPCQRTHRLQRLFQKARVCSCQRASVKGRRATRAAPAKRVHSLEWGPKTSPCGCGCANVAYRSCSGFLLPLGGRGLEPAPRGGLHLISRPKTCPIISSVLSSQLAALPSQLGVPAHDFAFATMT